MGGWGSGSYWRHGSRRKAEESLPLDIRKFHRKGLLVPGNYITSSWSVGDNIYSSIGGRVHEHHLLLHYQHKGKSIEQKIRFDWTGCNYGGRRIWFRCPDCGRRCAVIYSWGRYFSCRKCCRLLYSSQCQTDTDRKFTKANKLRRKIGAAEGCFNPLPWRKPLNMHQKTFDRIIGEIQILEKTGLAKMDRWLGLL